MSENKEFQQIIDDQMKTYFLKVLGCPAYLEQPKEFQYLLWIPYVRRYGFGKTDMQKMFGVTRDDRLRLFQIENNQDISMPSGFTPYDRPQFRVINFPAP